MKIPAPVLSLIYYLVKKNVGDLAAIPLTKIPNIEVIAKAYNDGQPLEVIIGLYVQSTQSLEDDEIAGKVGEVMMVLNDDIFSFVNRLFEEPLKDVLEDYLSKVSIPDFDKDDGNNMTVADLVTEIFKSLDS